MRTPILLAAMALLATISARSAPDGVHGALLLAQGMTGSAGSNSTTTAVRPHTEPGPYPAHDPDGRAPRTSLDNGTGSPLAGDEADRTRPNADVRRDGSTAPTDSAPSSRDAAR